MNQLKDQAMLYMIISTLLLCKEISYASIGTMLITIIVIGMIYLIDNQKSTCVLVVLYFIIAMLEPLCCYYLPVLFYSCLQYDYPILVGASLPMEILFFANAPVIAKLFLVPSMLLAFYMQRETKRREILEQRCKELRDTSEEVTTLLKDKNRALIEHAEYEVHVATLKERNRISREIHDHVGHMLSRALLQTGALLAVNQNKSVNTLLAELKNTLDTAMNNIRESVHDLHNDSIDLKEEVQKLIHEYQMYEIELEYNMEDEVEKNAKYCFLATVKEAFTNVVKHSNATKVVVYMYETNNTYQLTIKDNGTKKPGIISDGIGLTNMQERTQALNGVFQATYRDGFQIYISIPKQDNTSRKG
ncbi:MAG: sensor histidine kinase [bacterium]|nr:sensor histidine kinase [bacterium]